MLFRGALCAVLLDSLYNLLIANDIWFKKQDLLLSILGFTLVLVKYHLSIPTQRSRVCYKCLCVYLPRPFYRGCNEC